MPDIRSRLQAVLRQFLFEENTYIFRQNVERSLSSYLSGLVARREIKSYSVAIDEANSNEQTLYVDVTVVPISEIQSIHISLSVGG